MKSNLENDVYYEIKKIILEVLENEVNITPQSYLINDLNIDSISFFFILSKIESKYIIQVEPEKIYLKDDDYTVEDLVSMIESYLFVENQ